TSFGLWVNAIDNEYFDGDTVSGSIWYDNITAVSTDLTEATFTALTQEETVDTSGLTTAIEQAEALNESDYTADSWADLQTALTAAKTVVANAAATQSEADEAATALTSAISALETLPVVDSSALTTAIEQAEPLNESDYTTDSWATLQSALESAKIVAANGSAAQDEVDEAAAALTSAISGLEVAEKVTVPSATKITSVVNKAKGIKLTWNAVDGATSYQVYRKIGSGSWKKVKTTTSTTWTDTAATKKNGTKYQYKVYAVNSAGKSKASSTKTIYRLTAKHFTRAKNVSSKKISLKWTRNTKATGYIIEYSTSKSFTSSTTKTIKIKGNKNLTTTLKNLKKGKTYYIRMRAYKTSGSVTSYAGWSKVKTVKVKK
ncbi:MAG: fibronectin type III domain-containing protein, partial [Clostridiales bacterium]|nr:fibronectin type III domain-containing protein [Clostridiales bacterium]